MPSPMPESLFDLIAIAVGNFLRRFGKSQKMQAIERLESSDGSSWAELLISNPHGTERGIVNVWRLRRVGVDLDFLIVLVNVAQFRDRQGEYQGEYGNAHRWRREVNRRMKQELDRQWQLYNGSHIFAVFSISKAASPGKSRTYQEVLLYHCWLVNLQNISHMMSGSNALAGIATRAVIKQLLRLEHNGALPWWEQVRQFRYLERLQIIMRLPEMSGDPFWQVRPPKAARAMPRSVRNDSGMTLVDMVVAMLVIGILAGIALPSLLSQLPKAKEAEAIAWVGAEMRQQLGYYQNGKGFSESILSSPRLYYYDFEITEFSTNHVVVCATPEDEGDRISPVWGSLDARALPVSRPPVSLGPVRGTCDR